MIRTVLTPEQTHIEFDIPAEYVGKQIEITCLSLDEIESSSPHKTITMTDFWGVLSEQTGKDLQNHVQNSRDEWERNI